MFNPMSHDFVRAACQKYPEELSRLITGVDNFAYEAAWPVESLLGEYSGSRFSRERLVNALQRSIWSEDDKDSMGAHRKFAETFNRSGLDPTRKSVIFSIVEEESLKHIERAISSVDSRTERFNAHGHHMRQYIARDSAGRFVKEVLSPLWHIRLSKYFQFYGPTR